MTRLDRTTLHGLPAAIARPSPERRVTTGIVHLGASAFHRAHQAAYIDTLLDQDPRWGIAAVSLRTRGVVDALARQDGLYTLAIRDAAPAWRVLEAHTAFLGPEDAVATLALLAAPATRLVTTTVTEKGYCLAADGTLDVSHPDIVHDLANPNRPRSAIGWIVAGLRARRAAGVAALAVMPCDNLADNGGKLARALAAFAEANDPELARWIAGEVRVPGTMVDSITPASDPAFLDDVAHRLTVRDEAAVQREAFAQWVIEDVDLPDGPDLAGVGAIVTGDVAAYERAKLRILNGAHSTLAYAGLLRGHASVADAMGDALLAGFVRSMVEDEVIPGLGRTAGLDLTAYAEAIWLRFRNPAIVHRLEQIAQDGSQKLPYRLGDATRVRLAAGDDARRLTAAAGAWVAFLMRRAREGVAIADPAAASLVAAASDGDAAAVVARLGDAGLLPLAKAPEDYRRAVAGSADAAFAGRWQEWRVADCS